MKRIALLWSLIALVILAACQPIVAPPPDTTSADTTPADTPAATDGAVQEGSYIDPNGHFTVPVPTNWTATTEQGFALLQSPAGRIQVYIGALEGVAFEEAAAQAWQTVDPTFDATPKRVQEAPPHPGVDRSLVYDYTTEEDRIVQAVAEEVGNLVYVTLIRGEIAELGRRGAQLNIILTGLSYAGVEEVDLSGVAPQTLTPELLDELRAYITASLATFDVPGAAVAVVQNDEVVMLEGFGVRARGSDEPITPQTRMMIGSTGKTMTTLLMAQLVDEGLLTWDTPVQAILPQFAVADPELSAQITVRNLVCACTGVPRRDFEFIFNAKELTAEAVIESLRTFEFFTDFGEAFQYSNQLVATGGWVAAAAAGGEYGSLDSAYFAAMEERVFGPIGMTATTFSFDEVIADGNYAMPHALTVNGLREPQPLEVEKILLPVAPAGASWSTAEDMARYLLTELNQGVTPDGARVVSEENLAVTWEPQVPVDAETSYGLGWFVGEYKGQPLIQHGGNTTGFSTDFAFLPEADLGIVVITNGHVTNAFNQAVRFRLLELAFDQPHEFDAAATFADAESVKATLGVIASLVAVDAETAAPLVGVYTNPALGEFEVQHAEDRLRLDVGEFTVDVLALEDENDEAAGYMIASPPIMGIPIQFDVENDLLVFGEGVTQYEFTRVE